jgi:hypothetical protein|tara:strand:- start:161 stop:1393 length:1233 start_codon:yes stop_codon:yes gene_type:complete
MKRSSVEEYADAVRGRYQRASREDKKDILDEFTGVTGYHRKAAIRLINTRPKARIEHRRGRRRQYGVEVTEGLRVAWEATDRICSKRLKPFLPELIDILQDRGELTVTPQVAQGICQISESTIDRLLGPFRHRGKRRPFSTTKPGSLLKAAIPIRTFGEWDEKRPGFFEVDLVAHCGESTEGLYLNTLSAVDVFTGWVECRGVWGKGQERVGAAVHHIAQRIPFPLVGLDSDNGGEFINYHLYEYCQRNEITFTRSRPYKKNDNAHVEQKNWSVVRRLIGYDRYTSRPALDQLNRIYGLVRLYVNFFQPVMQLKHKTRNGAKVHRQYDTAKTPYQRVLDAGILVPEQKLTLERQYHRLNPVKLRAQIDQALDHLWAIADHSDHHELPAKPEEHRRDNSNGQRVAAHRGGL